jgi:Fe-S cluster assembly iron-binding protein IscA
MAQDVNPNLALRITVESGGCHGFQYLMSLTTLPPLSSSASPDSSSSTTPSSDPNSVPPSSSSSSPSGNPSSNAEIDPDDTVFQALDGTSAKIVMDGPSLELLKGSKIDYTMELIGSQFKIVDNPLATSSCGCGTSFDIKA